MTEEKLRIEPCPGCGGEARMMPSKRVGFIYCDANGGCGYEMRRSPPAQAIAAWNQRTLRTSQDASGLAGELEELVANHHEHFSEETAADLGDHVYLHWRNIRTALRHTPDTDDETYEIGKRDGYELAVQQIDEATGGDGEFFGSTIPGETVDVPAMKRRIIDRCSTPDTESVRTAWQPIEMAPLWQVAVVMDEAREQVAIAQKAESDFGGHYWSIDPEDALEWEPAFWVPFPATEAPVEEKGK